MNPAQATADISRPQNMDVGGNRAGPSSISARRPTHQMGTRETSTDLEVAERPNTSWIFVTGLTPETIPDALKTYVQNNTNIGNVKCEKLLTRKDKWRSSFKIGVPRDEINKIMTADLWPSGIMFSPFMNIRRNPIMEKRWHPVGQRTNSRIPPRIRRDLARNY